LVALEKKCCRFLAIGLHHDTIAGDGVLDIGGPEGTKAMIVAEMGLPQE
jgi:hypothetical protein